MKWFISLSLLIRFNSVADASCGSATCPLNSQQFLGQGSLQIGYIYEYINQDQIYTGSTRTVVGAIPQHHDEVQTLNSSSTLQLQYGATEGLSFGVDVPFIHREHSHIHHHMDGDEWETWNFSAVGDMRINTQVALLNSSDIDRHLTVMAGVKLPTGVVDAKNGTGEEAEVGLQPGSGSTDVLLGINYAQTLCSVPTLSGEYSALPLAFGASYQLNGKGTNDWRFGNTLVASLGTAYQFTRKTTLLFQMNCRIQEFANVGATGEPRENTGGTWIFASPGFSIQLSDAFAAYSYVQLPVYQNVHGIQQTARFNLQFGITANVNLRE